MTIGEDRVRVKFDRSDNSLVNQIKQKSAELIDLCHKEQGTVPVGAAASIVAERNRCYALAMTHYEDAAMWAVKAATGESTGESK